MLRDPQTQSSLLSGITGPPRLSTGSDVRPEQLQPVQLPDTQMSDPARDHRSASPFMLDFALMSVTTSRMIAVCGNDSVL